MKRISLNIDVLWAESTEPDLNLLWLDRAFLSARKRSSPPASVIATYELDEKYTYSVGEASAAIWKRVESHPIRLSFEVLCDLFTQGLPVVRPLAAQIERRRGLSRDGLLLCYALSESKPLSSLLSEAALGDSTWQQMGALLRQLHDLKISVPDLSADDFVVLSNGKVYLNRIAGFRRVTAKHSAWTQTELQSLLTSLIRLRDSDRAQHFSDDDWLTLTHAYIRRARPAAD